MSKSTDRPRVVQPPAPDGRLVHNAIRMGGSRDERGVFQPGEVLVAPDRIQEVINEGRLDLEDLFRRGVIGGDGWEPPKAA